MLKGVTRKSAIRLDFHDHKVCFGKIQPTHTSYFLSAKSQTASTVFWFRLKAATRHQISGMEMQTQPLLDIFISDIWDQLILWGGGMELCARRDSRHPHQVPGPSPAAQQSEMFLCLGTLLTPLKPCALPLSRPSSKPLLRCPW